MNVMSSRSSVSKIERESRRGCPTVERLHSSSRLLKNPITCESFSRCVCVDLLDVPTAHKCLVHILLQMYWYIHFSCVCTPSAPLERPVRSTRAEAHSERKSTLRQGDQTVFFVNFGSVGTGHVLDRKFARFVA